MKTLKLKFIIIGVLAILMSSIILISCEQKEIDDITQLENVAIPQFNGTVFLTEDLYDKGEDFVTEILSKATENMILKFHNNYIIANTLTEMNVIKEVFRNEPYGFHFSDVDLSKYLSEDEAGLVQSRLAEDLTQSQEVLRNGPPCPCNPGKWCVGHWYWWGWKKDCH